MPTFFKLLCFNRNLISKNYQVLISILLKTLPVDFLEEQVTIKCTGAGLFISLISWQSWEFTFRIFFGLLIYPKAWGGGETVTQFDDLQIAQLQCKAPPDPNRLWLSMVHLIHSSLIPNFSALSNSPAWERLPLTTTSFNYHISPF